MNYEEQLKSISLIAAADLSTTGQFRFMKMTSTGIVQQTASTLVSIGVLQNNPEDTKVATIGFLGVSMVEAGAIIAKGANVMSHSDGRALTAVSTTGPICGIALQAAAAAGDIIPVLLRDQTSPGIIAETILATGAISLLNDRVILDSTSGVQALTLADGFEGQLMHIVMITDGGDSVITPTNLVGGTILTFDNVDSAVIMFNGVAWVVIGTLTAVLS